MCKQKNLWITATFIMCLVTTTQAATLYSWEFSEGFGGGEWNSASNDPYLQSATWTTGSGTETFDRKAGKKLRVGTWDTASFAAAESNNDYIEFTMAPVSGNLCSVDELTTYGRGASYNAGQVELRSSLDGYASVLDTEVFTGSNYRTFEVAGHDNLSTPVTFRLYGYQETAGNDFSKLQFRDDGHGSEPEVWLYGTAVPEPVSGLVFGLLGVTVLLRRPWRRALS